MKNVWALGLFLMAFPAIAVTVTSIDFKVENGESVVLIQSDGPLQSTQQENAQDKQFVIDLPGATLASPASRKLDTSSFDSPVSLVSPYKVDGGARVVITMRNFSTPSVTSTDNSLRVVIPGGASASNAQTQTQTQTQARAQTRASTDSPNSAAQTFSDNRDDRGNSSQSDAAAPDSSTDVSVGTVASPAPPLSSNDPSAPQMSSQNSPRNGDRLNQFIETRSTGRFSGSPVTIQVRDADLVDVFRLIGEASGFNIVMGDDVKGKITLSLERVPWDQALDLILRTQQLGAERTHNVLRIVSLANLAKEKRLELEAQVAAQASTPRVTRIFPISYASLGDLQTLLTRFAASTSAGGNLNDPVLIQSDERTNSILVRDTPDNVEKMRKLIEILDTQTPQVMIESKIVEASENFNNTLNGAFAFSATDNGGNVLGDFSFNGLTTSTATALVPGTTTGAIASTFSPSINFIPGIRRLNALLTLTEAESRLKVIGSPKVVVLNKESANIVSGQPVLIPSSTVQSGIVVGTSSVQQANMTLTVRPTVTNDGSILLDLTVSRDVPVPLVGGTSTQSGIANRNLRTKVLVGSGNTLVIGGVYTQTTTHTESGFPFLRKIPVLGALFGKREDSTQRAELFIFVTPRVLNEKEAGLSG